MTFDYSTLITDRTPSDVSRVQTLAAKGWVNMTDTEREEWRRPLKGAYTAADLNRVGYAMYDLKNRLESYGYAVDIAPRLNWQETDEPSAAELEEYRQNVATLRGILELLATTPSAPATMRRLTYNGANNIEKILVDIDAVIERVVKSFLRSDAFTMWSGAEHLPSADSDLGRTWAELDAMETTWSNWQVASWYLLLYGNLKAEGAVE